MKFVYRCPRCKHVETFASATGLHLCQRCLFPPGRQLPATKDDVSPMAAPLTSDNQDQAETVGVRRFNRRERRLPA